MRRSRAVRSGVDEEGKPTYECRCIMPRKPAGPNDLRRAYGAIVREQMATGLSFREAAHRAGQIWRQKKYSERGRALVGKMTNKKGDADFEPDEPVRKAKVPRRSERLRGGWFE